ncbi:sigma 54-interacting transcriptional regulator [Neobacillus niacini]|uniref:sigma-54 interaction domain-containing protein n=1 Tax=Neobacillus niacini TaxID=86668 RepID=UPI0007ABD79D|nr:sigma 54-interacting transcriptional regulator [Neobacillus niacini]MEC1522742.1 sigma 54-interacting transcriptional regulator [Neobacillus niacini]
MLKEKRSLYSLSKPIYEGGSIERMKAYSLNSMLSDLEELVPQQDLLLVDENGAPSRFVPFTTLIEVIFQEWKSLENVYQTLLRAVDDAITIVDNNGKVVAWNPKAEELYETSAEKIIGSQITDFFKEESVVLMATLQEGKEVLRQYNQPKEDVHVLINTLPVVARGSVIGGISVEREITNIVKLNNELTTTTAYIQDLESKIKIRHEEDPFHKIKGRSQALNSVITLAKKVAKTDAPVLITGESGVGKELFAQAIHNASARSAGPFFDLNCGAIPSALFESELFGYEKGAFTGAIKEGKLGKIATAEGGTLFLDEIGELPLELQVKLLRVLQEKQYYRVGGNKPIPVDVRIISATNQDLEEMVENGGFREDLYYRLNVVSISIPPLRDRIEDLPELVQMFLKEYSIKYQKPVPEIAPEVMVTLMHSPWNGNIRQLKNTMERMMILSDDDNKITSFQLPKELFKSTQQPQVNILREELVEDEPSKIIHALTKTYGNKSAAAKMLGMSRVTLYSKMKKYRI